MYDRLISALRKAYEYSMEWKRNPFRYAALYKKAADVIEELQKPKWIPVTERLP